MSKIIFDAVIAVIVVGVAIFGFYILIKDFFHRRYLKKHPEKRRKYSICLKRDTKENWLKVDPILCAGEIGVNLSNGTFRLGDGVKKYSELPTFAPINVNNVEVL